MPETNPQQMQPRPHVRGRGWKRTAAAAVLLLAGGAIVNVAVAWGCCSRDVSTYVDGSFMAPHLINWFEMSTPDPPEFSWRVDYTADWIGLGLRRWWITAASPWVNPEQWQSEYAIPTRRYIHANKVAAGWPLLSLQGTRLRAYDISREGKYGPNEITSQAMLCIATNPTASDASIKKWLPLWPIWPGFIINTVFYALLLWLLFFAPFAARRMIRRRRGVCATCAYPIGVSPVCTECGAAVSSA